MKSRSGACREPSSDRPSSAACTALGQPGLPLARARQHGGPARAPGPAAGPCNAPLLRRRVAARHVAVRKRGSGAPPCCLLSHNGLPAGSRAGSCWCSCCLLVEQLHQLAALPQHSLCLTCTARSAPLAFPGSLVNEEYKLWKKNSPFLVSAVQCSGLQPGCPCCCCVLAVAPLRLLPRQAAHRTTVPHSLSAAVLPPAACSMVSSHWGGEGIRRRAADTRSLASAVHSLRLPANVNASAYAAAACVPSLAHGSSPSSHGFQSQHVLALLQTWSSLMPWSGLA